MTPAPIDARGRAAVLRKIGHPVDLCTVPLPSLGDGEVLVRIECSTLCGSDRHTVTGDRNEPMPTVLGHEAIGVVTELGSQPPTDVQGTPLSIGDRVTWSCAVSCFDCDRCHNGLPQKCRSLMKYGHTVAKGRDTLSGGLADFILLKQGSSIVQLSPHLPWQVACPANCATATVAAAMRTAKCGRGDRVLIFGAGMLGLTATAMAHAAQAKSITVVDPVADRLARAKRFGATDTCQVGSSVTPPALADGSEGFDVILEFSGSATAVAAAVRVGDVGARIVLVGTVMPSDPVAMDPQRWVRNCLSMHGIHNYRPDDLVAAVRFLESQHATYPFASLIEESFSLADIDAALTCLIDQRPVRVAVIPDPASMNDTPNPIATLQADQNG
ncbi:5-exo-hydroxycamphor dehydrogenase [Rubripirellula lacrimiformis]|uniref:alcohol dehydrogenase n=1 Tax=Rubripirellula lacrimiformis TaxID=1930273 RepID=A0A517NL98_9BACT|nr:zinc-binding dehydrogenase [Rubripirellula lacrimiformis]QDT07859.1 5-exo-hydroxycamphor dehydrogenase [Rubripirellula lacrimiformis]